jgi:hypothetical protein
VSNFDIFLQRKIEEIVMGAGDPIAFILIVWGVASVLFIAALIVFSFLGL